MKKITPKIEPTPSDHPFRAIRRAAVPLVAFASHDPQATIVECQRIFNGTPAPCLEWDAVRGLRPINKQADEIAAQIGTPTKTINPVACLALIESNYAPADDAPGAVFFIHAGHKLLGTWQAVQAIWNLRDKLKSFGANLVLLGPSVDLPPELAGDVPLFEEPAPTPEQMEACIDTTVKDARIPAPNTEERKRVMDTLTGYLSIFGIEQSLALATTKTGLDTRKLWELKVASLKSTAGLEISQPTNTFANLAGCDGIKSFLLRVLNGRQRPRALYFLDELEKMIAGGSGGDLSGTTQKQIEQFLYWTEEKKVLAVLLVGVPGGGKSFTAQCTAGHAGIPLLRGSISAAQGSLVGQSTANMRTMLTTVDSVSGGQTLLLATCNSLDSLTPEVLSRFKLGVFVYDYPTTEEAAALWALYGAKYQLEGQPIPKGTALWTGREVESCCHRAWLFDCPLDEAAASVVPVSQANGTRMDDLRRTLSGRFLSAANAGIYKYSETKIPAPTGRRINA